MINCTSEFLIIDFWSDWIPEEGLSGPTASVCVYANEDLSSVMLMNVEYEGDSGPALVKEWEEKLRGIFGSDIKIDIQKQKVE